MKILGSVIFIIILAAPVSGNCYHVESSENCQEHKGEAREIDGHIGAVIMGERPFLTFIMENGDELLMLPENGKALNFFRENEGKKARISYQKGQILLADDFSENGAGNCETAYYFKSGSLIK